MDAPANAAHADMEKTLGPVIQLLNNLHNEETITHYALAIGAGDEAGYVACCNMARDNLLNPAITVAERIDERVNAAYLDIVNRTKN